MRILLRELAIDHCRILKKDSYILLKPRIGPRLPEKTLPPRQLYRAFDYSYPLLNNQICECPSFFEIF